MSYGAAATYGGVVEARPAPAPRTFIFREPAQAEAPAQAREHPPAAALGSCTQPALPGSCGARTLS